jgi:photosystem II stability/assembly factor-like uncharacterized protein
MKRNWPLLVLAIIIVGVSWLTWKYITSPSGEVQRDQIEGDYARDFGGAIAGKIQAANPELFPEGMSDIERVRLLEFMIPRVHPTNGKIESGENEIAVDMMRARKLARNRSQLGPMRLTSANTFGWKNIGPTNATYSGRVAVSGIAVDPRNPMVVYVAGGTGGLWKTPDGGSTWSALTDYLPSQGSASVAVDPVNGTVWYGTGDIIMGGYGASGLWRSLDGGATWSQTLPFGYSGAMYPLKIVIDPADHNRIFIANYYGALRSVDGGASWTKCFDFSITAVRDVAIDPTNSQIVYLAVSRNATNAGIWKSTDGGTTWTRKVVGFPSPSDIGRVQIALAPTSPNVLTAMSGNIYGGFLGLYKSSDAGESWTKTNLSLAGYDATLLEYHNAVTISPSDANTMIAGTMTHWRTTDGGEKWGNLTTGGFDIHTYAWSGTTLYAGSDEGIYRSSDNGSTWENLNNNIVLTQFYPGLGMDRSTPSTLWAGSQDNGAYRRTSIGWQARYVTDVYTTAVDPTNSATVYINGLGSLERSTDGGQSWTAINSGLVRGSTWATTPIVIDPRNPAVLYTGGSNFCKSTNRGDSWTTLSTLPYAIGWIAMNPAGTIYLSLLSGAIYRSADGGSSWAQTAFPGTFAKQVRISPIDGRTVYVVGSNGSARLVWKSSDEGQTWASISGDLPTVQMNCLAVNKTNSDTLYLGTDLGFFWSVNGGVNWLHADDFPNAIVNDLGITGDGNLVAITYGRGMWASKIAGPDTVLPPPPPPPQSITITSPAGGEVWKQGSHHTISWKEMGGLTGFNLSYSLDGNNWTQIVSGYSGTSYSWAIPKRIWSMTSFVRVASGTTITISKQFTISR